VDVHQLTYPRILAFATKGAGSNDEARLRALLGELQIDWFPFDRSSKFGSFRRLLRVLKIGRYDLAVMEGTGLAGGVALIWSSLLGRCRYVVSSGDAVAPWLAAIKPWLEPPFNWYEGFLCKRAAGFIGWTPYLVGRALTFGCPRAVTAAGWALHPKSSEEMAASRARLRRHLGITDETIVVGIVGSLAWNDRFGFCYGSELVRAIRKTSRPDIAVLVVGEGEGLDRLRELAGDDLARRIFLTGPVPANEVINSMAAMDVASLPQSVDGVGSFRYTTKISEYIAARLPVITGQIPMAYDLDTGWLWRLPGRAPWKPQYLQALSRLMEEITWDQIRAKQAALPQRLETFDKAPQVQRVTSMILDILAEKPR
jgi:glycosyltransferase involved in cell wall biosynthesis